MPCTLRVPRLGLRLALGVVCLTMPTPHLTAAETCPFAATLLQTQAQVRFVATGDLDGRSGPDLVLPSLQDVAVTVALNRGDGTFATVEYRFGASAPGVVSLADYDGARGLDILVGDDRRELHLLLNNGDGTFATAIPFGVGARSSHLAAADVDRRSGPDFVSMGNADSAVYVWRNNGDATFQAPERYDLPAAGAGLAVADLDGADGPDIFALAGSGVVLLNRGDGSFAAPVELGLAIVDGNAVAAVDVDGSSGPDLVVSSGFEQQVLVFRNAGNATFPSRDFHALDARPAGIAAFDLDGAPGTDLAIMGSRRLWTLRNSGDGTFAPPVSYPLASQSAFSLVGANFDGQGWDDLAVANGTNLGVTLLPNQAGAFRTLDLVEVPVPLIGGYDPVTRPVIADLDGALGPDLILGHEDGVEVDVLLNRGDGTFSPAGAYPTGLGATSVAAGDLDQDDRPELLVTNGIRPELLVFPNAGDGTFGPPAIHAVPPNPGAVAAIDLDGSLGADAIVLDQGNDAVLVFRSSGGRALGPAESHPVGDGPGDLAVGDVDGIDGPDILTLNWTSDDFSVLRNRGDGTLLPEVRYPVGPGLKAIALADLDSANGPDVVIATVSSDGLSVHLNRGDGTFAPGIRSPIRATALAAGDVDGDDIPDLILVIEWTARFVLLRGLGDGTFAAPEVYATWPDPVGLAIAELDSVNGPELVVSAQDSVAIHHGCGPRPEPCDAARMPAIQSVLALKDAPAGDVILRWSPVSTAGDGYAAWYTPAKTSIPACRGCPGSSAVAGCQPTGSAVIATCRDAGALARGPSDLLYYEVRGVCAGVEGPR